MNQRIAGVALTFLLSSHGALRADGSSARPVSDLDCYCAPAQLIWCGDMVPPPRTISPPARAWAQPTAAPPSKAPLPGEPPLAVPNPQPKAAVSESHSYYDSYAVARQSGAAAIGGRCTAGFWNLSDRDVKAKINGKTLTLPRGKNVPVEVPREFVWQLEGREPQVERIPAGESALTIVIRR
jgi:hypothetical protein